jgi:hypothetical protein
LSQACANPTLESKSAYTRTVSPARAWTIAGLRFAAGFVNYLDRAIVSVASR